MIASLPARCGDVAIVWERTCIAHAGNKQPHETPYGVTILQASRSTPTAGWTARTPRGGLPRAAQRAMDEAAHISDNYDRMRLRLYLALLRNDPGSRVAPTSDTEGISEVRPARRRAAE